MTIFKIFKILTVFVLAVFKIIGVAFQSRRPHVDLAAARLDFDRGLALLVHDGFCKARRRLGDSVSVRQSPPHNHRRRAPARAVRLAKLRVGARWARGLRRQINRRLETRAHGHQGRRAHRHRLLDPDAAFT